LPPGRLKGSTRSVHLTGKVVVLFKKAYRLIDDDIIEGGIVAKIEPTFEAVRGNVSRVHITRWEGPKTFDCLLDRSSDEGTIIGK